MKSKTRLKMGRMMQQMDADMEGFTKYTDAVSAYWKADSATLYGIDEQCGVTCIMSK